MELVREVCEQLDRRGAYGFAFAPSEAVVRLYAKFGFRAVGRVDGDCGLVGMVREPLTLDNVSVPDDAKVVEPVVADLKTLRPKVATLKTSESNATWLDTPKLKKAEARAFKLEEFKLVTSG